MAVPATKEELLIAIDTTFSKLEADLDRVPQERTRDATMPGHAKASLMSPADLVAYLIGWNAQVLTWHARRQRGLPDEFPAPGIAWNNLGALAQRFYVDHQDDSWDDLRAQLRHVKTEIVTLIDGSSNEDLYGSPWYGTWTMGRMISLNTSSPYANARSRVRAWLRAIAEA